MVDMSVYKVCELCSANLDQIRYGLSVQSWPSGHATDSEEAIAFTELKEIDCMVEKFPLTKANDAFSRISSFSNISRTNNYP